MTNNIKTMNVYEQVREALWVYDCLQLVVWSHHSSDD